MQSLYHRIKLTTLDAEIIRMRLRNLGEIWAINGVGDLAIVFNNATLDYIEVRQQYVKHNGSIIVL